MKKQAKILILTLLALAALDATCQTRLKNIPIISYDAYIIKVWAFNEEVNQWAWYDHRETYIEQDHGWQYNNQLNIEVDKYDEFKCLFIRGYESCKDTTELTIYGAYLPETIQDKEDLRVHFFVNGEPQSFGTKIERP